MEEKLETHFVRPSNISEARASQPRSALVRLKCRFCRIEVFFSRMNFTKQAYGLFSTIQLGLTFKALAHLPSCPMQDVKYFRLREGEKRKNNYTVN